MHTLLVLSVMVATAMGAGYHRNAGPTRPIDGFGAESCLAEGEFFVDAENMCWYHQCVLGDDEQMTLLPRRCALGSKVSYNFIAGFSNPCTINFDAVFGYECMRSRPSVDGPPECFDYMECHNGGTKTFESDKCWCLCPDTWQGDFDCSKPTRDVTYLEPGSDICIDGDSRDDWCALEGCLNGGDCYNQCDTYWCDCPEHEKYNYVGKRCETMETEAQYKAPVKSQEEY